LRVEDSSSSTGRGGATNSIAVPTATATPGSIASQTQTSTVSAASSAGGGEIGGSQQTTTATNASQAVASANGLSTGAKAGIAVAAVAIALIAILVAFLFWRRRRRAAKSSPTLGYANNSTERDLQGEKEMNVVNTSTAYTPVEHHGGFEDSIPTQHSPRSYGAGPVAAVAAGVGGAAAATAAHGSHNEEPYRDVPTSPQLSNETPVSDHAVVDRGMSAAEQARWDEEEARLDAAIAEAERRK